MARTNDPHSASAQFFINLKDNTFLDFSSFLICLKQFKDGAIETYFFGQVIEVHECC